MFRRDRRGGVAIEYAMVVALIVVVMLVALHSLASTTIDIWSNVSTKVVNS